MDNKIKLLFLLLCIVIIIAATYVVVNQSSFGEGQPNIITDDADVTEEDISNEIDDLFLSEDEEIEIGEMV